MRRRQWITGIVGALVVAAVAALWWLYAPGADSVGIKLRLACGLLLGVLFVVTAMHPLGGLLLLAFCTPLANGVPLWITGGAPYMILVFGGAGFIAGWLLRETIDPRGWRPFRGQGWLFAFVAVATVSAAASFLRYYPVWMWDEAVFKTQPVNTAGMLRLDVSRHVVMSLVNVVFGAMMVTAVHGVMQRNARVRRAGMLVVCALVLGVLCACGVAIYQAMHNLNFCANRSYYWTRLTRVNGTCTDPNAFGTMTGLALSLGVLALVFAGPVRLLRTWGARLGAAAAVVVMALALQYSGSRSSLLSALLAVLFAVAMACVYYVGRLLHGRRVPVAVVVVAVLAVVAGCGAALVAVPNAIHYLNAKIEIGPSSPSTLKRLKRDLMRFDEQGGIHDLIVDPRRIQYWRHAWDAACAFPLSGIGIGAYVIELPNRAAINGEYLPRTDNACNYYLHYAAETGAAGILCLCLFYATVLAGLVAGVRRWREHGGEPVRFRLVLGATLVIFLIVLFFGVHTMADEVNTAFAIMLGLAVAETGGVPGFMPLWLRRWLGVAVLMALALHSWRTVANNRDALNGDRMLGAAGVKAEVGWFNWENWDGQPFRVRWMSRDAMAVMLRENIELGIPVMSGAIASTNNPQRVSFFINGTLVRTHSFETPGEWALIRLPVPYASPFKQAVLPHCSLRIAAAPTWVPALATGAEDTRALGVLVGEFRWLDPEGIEGGWHAREFLDGTTPFNWSSQYAWRKVPVTGTNKLSITLYASNVLLRRFPLDVAVYVNRSLLDTVSLREKRWDRRTYSLPPGIAPGSTAIVEFATSRVWVPRNYGFDDRRPLGVAVGEIVTE